MTTVSDLVSLCRNDYLLASGREPRNLLDGDVDDSTTTFTFVYPLDAIAQGAKVSVGLEDCYVWATDPAVLTATVQRGDSGSTAADHTDQDIVLVNPRFSDAQILRAMNDELHSLSSPDNGLFQVRSTDFDFTPSSIGYDLSTTGLISVWEVRYQAVDGTDDWPLVAHNLWDLRRNMPTDGTFTTGTALFVRDCVDSGATVRVSYRATFTALSTAADDVSAVSGLHAEAVDILAIGAGMRLLSGREAARNYMETQGDTRRASEVPPGANMGGWRALAGLRQQRVTEERTRLARLYPDRW